MVSGVDEYVCYVNSVLADGILDMCGVDTVVSGVDEYVCGVSSNMTADELDVCGCDSLVSYGAGDSSGVEVVDDVVACGDDTLLPDAFRVVGGCTRNGSSWFGGRAHLRRQFPAARATTDARNVFASHCLIFCLIIHDTVNACCVATMLARSGDRTVPALFGLLHILST